MFLQRIFNPSLAINTYIIGNPKTKQCAIIDPTRIIQPIIDSVRREGYEIVYILETHVHADFISGSKELKHYYQNAPKVYCSGLGGPDWTPSYADVEVTDGADLHLGSILLRALHTPGHTPEHVVWLCFDETRTKEHPALAFTGDLLFVGGVGRPDLLGEKNLQKLSKDLYRSLFVTLSALPDFMEIYPAHGAGSLCGKMLSPRQSSTLGYERSCNESLAQKTERDWIAELHHNMPAAPRCFSKIKKTNVQGPSLKKEKFKNPKHLSDSDLKNELKKAWLLDVRHPESYAHEHVANSTNVPFGASFTQWAGMVVPDDTPLIVIASDASHIETIYEQFWMIGIDHLVGFCLWEDLVNNPGVPKESLALTDVRSLAGRIDEKNVLDYILDVRTPAEWDSGHIPQAHHLELARIPDEMDKIPKDKSIAVICGSGYRSSIVSSLLQKAGYRQITNVLGGMQAWKAAGLPTTKEARLK